MPGEEEVGGEEEQEEQEEEEDEEDEEQEEQEEEEEEELTCTCSLSYCSICTESRSTRIAVIFEFRENSTIVPCR